jgi:hypothetical protein
MLKPVHFLLRVPQFTRIESSPPISVNTIECHEELIRARGLVTIAKFGQPGTVAIVKKLTAQIAEGVAVVPGETEPQARHSGLPDLECFKTQYPADQ